MRDASGQRLQLKSKLLIGAAGITAAAMSTAAFAADAAPPAADATAAPTPAPVVAPAATPAQAMTPISAPKWLPYVDIGGGVGSGFAIGRANAFVPVWQDLNSLMFVRFGADTGHRNSEGDFNLGLGYRTKIDSDWILGAFAGFDSTQSDYNHTFNQYSFGVEAMSADWDVRANAYLAKKTNRTIENKFALYIHDTSIAVLQAQETALSGFDGEVGYRVFNTDSTDVRVFAGAYTFHHADVNATGIGTNFNFPYRDLSGPKLRAEVNVFDLDMLGPQSRLSIEGQISHDNVHHTSEYIGATLRIALNDPSGPGAQALDDLDRRMADPVRRNDNVLTQWQFNKPEPVIIYNGAVTSEPTNTLFYAERRSSAAEGSYANQTTIQDATARGGAGKNALIVLTDAGGSTIDTSGTTIAAGETVTGAGTFKVRGIDSGAVFNHDFAAASGPVSLSAASGSVFTVTGNATIADLSIKGPFVDAIYGNNVGDVTISGVTIDGAGVGTNGIVFNQTNTSGTSNITIKNTSITGVTNDGIELNVSATSGLTSTTNLIGNNLTINAGHDGVSVTSIVAGTSNATVYAGIHDSSLTAGNAGSEMSGTTSGAGVLTQTLLVDPTAISGGSYGIYVHGSTTGGMLTQNVDVDDVTMTGVGIGVDLSGTVSGGRLAQTLDVDGLEIGTSYVGVQVGAHASAGKIDQTVGIANLTAKNALADGIYIDAQADGVSKIDQNVTLSHVDVHDAGAYGISLNVYAADGATALQAANIDDLTAKNAGVAGVSAYLAASSPVGDAPSVAAQYITIGDATISGSYTGVSVRGSSSGSAVIRQDIDVLNSSITDNSYGVTIRENALNGASASQNIYLAYDDISHNAIEGVAIAASASGGDSFASQHGGIYYVDLSHEGQAGLDIRESATAADVEQQLYVVGVNADHSQNGLYISSSAEGYTAGSYTFYPAHAEQNLYIEYSSFSHEAGNGIEISSKTSYFAQTDQSFYFYGVHADHNGGDGLRASTSVGQGGTLNQSLYFSASTANNNAADGISVSLSDNAYSAHYAYQTNGYPNLLILGSQASHNGGSGIDISSSDYGPSYLIQHVTVSGTTADSNGGNGLYALAFGQGVYAANLQYLTISKSHFDHNAGDGAAFAAIDDYGPYSFGLALQEISSSGNTFNANGGVGFSGYLDAFGLQGRAEQYITDAGSQFDSNAGSGISLINNVHDGVYITGYSCDAVQGIYGGCAIGRQRLTVAYSDVSGNGGAGIGIYNDVSNYGTLYGTSAHGLGPTIQLVGDTVTANGGDGLHIQTAAIGKSYAYSYALLLGSQFNDNGGDGVDVNTYAASGSRIRQGAVLYGIPGYTAAASGNAGDGVHVGALTNGGTVQQLVGIYYSDVSGNAGNGVSVTGIAGGGATGYSSVVGQYAQIVGSNLSGNGASGAAFTTAATGHYATASQQISIVGSTLSGNQSGVIASAVSYDVASVTQNLYFGGDTISNNTGDGIDIVGAAGAQSFSAQYVAFGAYDSTAVSYITGNGGNGIAVAAVALSAGDAEQNVLAYNVNATGNAGNGMSVISVSSGYGVGAAYIYYSHVQQNVIAAYDHFDGNKANGFSVDNSAYYGGKLDQLVELVGVSGNGNGGAGFYMASLDTSMRGNNFALGTNITSNVYLYGSTFNGNTGNGIDLRSSASAPQYIPAYFGGYSYLTQHIHVSGVQADKNGGAGIALNANETGAYSLNAEYLTIGASEFDHNTGAGADLRSTASYGPGGFGDTFEQISIADSDFSHNGGDGMYLGAFSSGRQGRAEQHVTVTGSNFDSNSADGIDIRASAEDGIYLPGYTCDVVQGLPGGCAFVRQDVVINYSDISSNTGDGVRVTAYANNYGAIYGAGGRPHAPTLQVYASTVNGNGGRGLDVSNHVTGNSYLYQYIATIDSTFDHNHSDGIYSVSYVGGASTMLQRSLVYSYHAQASSSYNSGNGFKSSVEALGGSFARDVNIAQGVNLNQNGSFGFDGAVAYADSSSTGLQINGVYYNNIDQNGDGLGLYSIGAGAQQASYIGGNEIAYNAFVGAHGEANFGAFQYIGIYTFGNSVHDNGTDYLFNSFGGSTQILN